MNYYTIITIIHCVIIRSYKRLEDIVIGILLLFTGDVRNSDRSKSVQQVQKLQIFGEYVVMRHLAS